MLPGSDFFHPVFKCPVGIAELVNILVSCFLLS